MMDLTGLLTINGKDAWTEYSAFLCEDKPEDNSNFNELLRPLKAKPYTSVDFRERDGEELPDELPAARYEARDVTLYFAVYAATQAEYNTCRDTFQEAICSGWQNVKLKGLPRTYRFYYKEASETKLVEDKTDGRVVGCWKVKFREPKPGV